MEVLFCFDHRYEQHFGVAVTSLILNNLEHLHKVHIVTKTVSADLNQKINQLKEKTNIDFQVYEVNDEDVKNLKVSEHISSAAYYRLLAPDLLPQNLSKILYLDSDLVVNGSILELYNYDLTDYIIAAYRGDGKSITAKKRLELKGDYYFNSGVMLINLQAWHRHNIGKQCIEYIREYPEKVILWDQDALNKIIDGQFLHLDKKWNSLVDLFGGQSKVDDKSIITHFIGSLKPWQAWCISPEKEIYWSYLKQSPWASARAEIPNNLDKWLSAIKAIGQQLKNSRRKLK
ncbi:MAG TPA: glycosyltransferase family 8 protein [Nostocaceae cyanobacterium]|nr:glycosyltransferase family 8 protein [Nostocaceae cyanobacterium]